jgi:uncharacterized membrane-anchored protein YjiN (DUF445 family)
MFKTFKNILAGEDVVGRDKITNNNLPHPRQLDRLSESYKKEIEENQTTSSIIDELKHYRTKDPSVRDLEEKLSSAGFGFLIEDAEELKEIIAKLIVKNQHYRSAQKIIIQQLFRIFLEQEIQDKLGENVLEIFNRQIIGMVFFLTGNCHIEWE